MCVWPLVISPLRQKPFKGLKIELAVWGNETWAQPFDNTCCFIYLKDAFFSFSANHQLSVLDRRWRRMSVCEREKCVSEGVSNTGVCVCVWKRETLILLPQMIIHHATPRSSTSSRFWLYKMVNTFHLISTPAAHVSFGLLPSAVILFMH